MKMILRIISKKIHEADTSYALANQVCLLFDRSLNTYLFDIYDHKQALETYRISYLLFFRTCVTLFRLRNHIHRNSIFHTTFKD